MTDHKSPGDRVLDLVVFGPAGLALVAAEEFPKLVDKGRHRLEGQVRTARLVGQAAVQMGRRQLGQMAAQRKPKPTAPAREKVSPHGAETSAPPVAYMPSPVEPGAVSGATPTANGTQPTLAIPGYDSLSASQVVQRLAGLSQSELADVRAHEQSHRHRRTILNRVEQLLTGADAE
jgi:hypothetical protein